MSSVAEKVPVVVIGFKRAELTDVCLDYLGRCRSLDSRPVLVYLDGARCDEERKLVDQVEQTVRRHMSVISGIKIVRRERNYGCRGNVTAAIGEVLARHKAVIVVEEDVRVSPSFLEYMDLALARFGDDRRIWCVNGFVSPWIRVPCSYREDVYLSRRHACWGWGTWRDRWQEIDFDIRDWPAMRDDPVTMESVRAAGHDIPIIAELQFSGKINTWAIACTLHMLRKGLYAVNPRRSLTKNIGFATDCENCNGRNEVLEKQKFYDFLPRMPSGPIEECPAIAKLFRDDGLIEPTWRFFFRRLRRKYCHFSWTPSHNEPIVI